MSIYVLSCCLIIAPVELLAFGTFLSRPSRRWLKSLPIHGELAMIAFFSIWITALTALIPISMICWIEKWLN